MALGKSRQLSIVPQLGWLTAHARKSLEGGIVVEMEHACCGRVPVYLSLV